MEYILFSLIVLAGYHFYVENVIIPTYELELREKLFVLQERIFKAREKQSLEISSETFDRLEKSVQLTAQTLSSHNLLDFFLFVFYRDRSGERPKVSYSREILNSSDSQVKDIFSTYMFIVKRAFVVGTSGWILYFFPFVLIFLILKHTLIIFKVILGFGNKLEIFRVTESKLRRYQEFEIHHAPPSIKKNAKAYAYC